MIDIFSGYEDSVGKLFYGVEPGSLEAKKVWAQIDANAHSPEAVKTAKAINPDANGMYMGKVLAHGAGAGQGDFQMLVDKLQYVNGYDSEVAHKIASSIKFKLYGVH